MSERVAIAPVRRVGRGRAHSDQDLVAVESPLSIAVSGGSAATAYPLGIVMRTPGDDRHLVLGLLHAEGLVRRPADVLDVTTRRTGQPDDTPDAIEVRLAPHVQFSERATGRALHSTSACGLCGRLSMQSIDRGLSRPVDAPELSRALIASLPSRLRARQTVFAETGGLHAAGLFDAEGVELAIAEDVGRHNAVDKVIGAAFDAGRLPLDAALLAVSGRVAFEIVQKAALAGVVAVVAVGAPSDLAVTAARAAGLTLVGFARDGRFNVYTGVERVK